MFVELARPSEDVISCIKFAPTGRHLLASSLDGNLNLYGTSSAQKVANVSLGETSAALSVDWLDTIAVAGCVDGRVKVVDFERQTASCVGDPHSLGVSSVTTVNSRGLVVAGSWDKSMQLIDSRSGEAETHRLEAKVFALDSIDDCIVASMGGNTVNIYDVRQMATPLISRRNELKYQARSLSCMPSGKGYALGSVEGRISVEYLDQSDNFCFKCHRQATTDGKDLVDPVNALVFHGTSGSLISGGKDGYVCLWDVHSKKRTKRYARFDSSVVALDYAHAEGKELLAVACSDDDYKVMEGPGDKAHSGTVTGSRLYIREMETDESLGKTS
ncbi:unnamed protein product [Kuraishia capsulata CBS 1993]|uniref:Anaphase-promoting complex subunit 4 WD40 domain-containing protein n=1 Tax=Kuraishia capsulata CBS 1993 TaxID=1382522 RepID=W6MWI4_9ASCO|nr:uncharacterized protein KUCA_T00003468001 [Kuraishia capsulata CBS 1993]CDK27490.1 unnamed protein product [Kuraishia capsulata CBS 1993]